MNPIRKILLNSAVNRFFTQFSPFSVDTKRPTAWQDYGYPTNPTFADYWSMYQRNGIAKAGVMRHIEKTWQTYPTILEREEAHEQTEWERQLEELFERIDFWKLLKGTDERNRVGRYAGIIFIYADGKRPDEPVDTVPGGLDGLIKIIPCFEEQLTPSAWDENPNSRTYGEPVMYSYNEADVGDRAGRDPGRVMSVHASRVHIWAEGADDGSIYGVPALKAGLNALITMEKISGAGGEGFWKTARAPMTMNISDDAGSLNSLAQMLGTTVDGIPDKMDEVIADFLSGADKSLLTQGIETKPLSISLPSPKEFFDVALQEFAASVSCPLPILVGHQMGDRASQEDSNEWNSTNMARRTTLVMPEVKRIIRKLMAVGIIRERDFVIDWEDLTAPSLEDRLANAKAMGEVNKSFMGTGEPVPFSRDRVLDTAGFDPEEEDADVSGFEEGDEEDEADG